MKPVPGKYLLLIENLPDAFAYHKIITDDRGNPLDYIFLDVNRAFESMTELPKDEILNKKVSEVLPEIEKAAFYWIGTYGKVALTGETAIFESFSEPLQRWYEVIVYTDAPGYFATLFRDITDTKERRQAEADLKESEERLSRVNKCLLNLGPDYQDNINKIVALCGELLGGACAIYNRLDQGMLCVWGHWQLPSVFKMQDQPEGHICFDLIRQVEDEMLYIPDLLQTSYYQTDPNVQQYDLKSYVGHVVKLAQEPVGSLCVVFQQHYNLSESDYNILGIMAKAIEAEERRKHSEEALLENEKRFQKMLAVVPDMISIHDPQMNILYSNWNGFAAVPEERRKLNAKCYQVYRSFDHICPDCKAIGVLQTKEPYQAELELPEGIWIDLRTLPVLDRNNNVELIVKWVRDITERKQAEETLCRREQEFRALAENAPDIVTRFDRNLRHIYINPAIEKYTGIPREEFMGRTNEELQMPEGQTKLWSSKLREVFQGGRETETFFDFLTPDGRKYYHSRIVPEFAPDGTVETVLAINRDITPIKEMETVKARQLLKRSFPDDLPALPGLALAASYHPVSTLQGDYYNVIYREDKLLFYLVDAVGDRENGIMHSLYVRNTIDTYLSAREDWADLSPARLLRYLADQHCRDNQAETSPICILIGVIYPSHRLNGNTGNSGGTGNLCYAAHGFCTPPLIISDGKTVELHINGTGENINGAGNSKDHTVPLTPGSTFIFRTSGPFRLDRESSEPRFRELCATHSHLPSELISSAIDEEINSLNSDSPNHEHGFAALVIQVPAQEQRLNFTVESDFQHISEAKEKTAAFLNTFFKLESDLIDYHELLVNAIEHGNKHDGGKKVSVYIVVTDKYYRIAITDQGEGFNWRQRIDRELDWESESERGRGIIMTRMMTDYLGYNERGNRVTMINLIG